MDTQEEAQIIDSILQRKEQDEQALALLLKRQREKDGHLLALQVPMGEISSFVTSVDLGWVAGKVQFAADLPIFKEKSSEGLKRVKVDKDTIADIQQRKPDWRRQLAMTAYLATQKHHKFPPLLVIGYQDWVYDDGAEEWGVDKRAMQDSLTVTPMEPKGAYCDLDLTDTKFYALDGQHRLMAIIGLRELLTKGKLYKHEAGGEPVKSSYITRKGIIAQIHELTNEGEGIIHQRLEGLMDERIGIEIMPAVSHGETYREALLRLRQTFVDINENAKKLTKGEISQLDETNGFRVVARNIMVSHELLQEKTADKQGHLGETSECYTTLETLVGIAESYLGDGKFPAWKLPWLGQKTLGFVRPSDDALSEGQEVLKGYFDALSKLPSHDRLIQGKEAQKIRAEDGEDNILFRPIAQMALAVAVASLEKKRKASLSSIIDILTHQEDLKQLKLRDHKTPWFGVLCEPVTKNMRKQKKYQELCQRLFSYLLGDGESDDDVREELRTDFAKARQIDAEEEISIDLEGNRVKTDEVRLPNPWR